MGDAKVEVSCPRGEVSNYDAFGFNGQSKVSMMTFIAKDVGGMMTGELNCNVTVRVLENSRSPDGEHKFKFKQQPCERRRGASSGCPQDEGGRREGEQAVVRKLSGRSLQDTIWG